MTSNAPHAEVAARAVGITKVYGTGEAEVRALDGVTVDIAAGEFTAVMGPSGSGKSTLIHCLAALHAPTSGSVYLGDTELSALSDAKLTELRRDHIGFVFQSYNLQRGGIDADHLRPPFGGAAPGWMSGCTDERSTRPPRGLLGDTRV